MKELNSNKAHILQILRKNKAYISGQELCKVLSVSRTAVWKAINQLKSDGYLIEAVQNKGYCLIGSPDLVTEDEVGSLLNTSWAGAAIEYREQVGSTNVLAKQLAEKGAVHGTLVLTNMQNMGRGRRGRSWVMKAGTAIAMSLILRPSLLPEHASRITLIMGMSVVQACRELYNIPVSIKWPNDVILDHKKICGILTEMSAQVDYVNYIVVGVGINANLGVIPEEIEQVAASLDLYLGQPVKRGELIARILEHFETYFDLFMKTEDMSELIRDYNSMLGHKDMEVKVIEPKNSFEGISEGINASGELLIRLQDGSCRKVLAGEVSVRGMNGYI